MKLLQELTDEELSSYIREMEAIKVPMRNRKFALNEAKKRNLLDPKQEKEAGK